MRLVLLIEDNRTDVVVISRVLTGLGMGLTLQVETDGEEAVTYWESICAEPGAVCPSLVLLDLNLPRVTGLEVLRRIRDSERGASVPVIIVTSSDSSDELAAARAMNAAGYFQKPAELLEYMRLGQMVTAALSPD